jgi:transcription initiation factor IIE alpha subunit
MTNNPIRPDSEIIVNVCDVCKTRYSLEEAKQKDMTCCGKPLKQVKKEIPIPLGP